jgi:hypothetical protein
MALPSSGVLTLADIQTEFGGTNPIDLSDYYRAGGLVPDSALNAAIPTSGAISVSDFYGATNVITLNFATTFTGTINSGTSITIGTARSTRMVHIMGYFTANTAPPSSGSIGGVSMTILRNPATLTWWQGWAKVPTGTSATVTLDVGGGTCYVSTFDTVNSGASNTGYINNGTVGVPSGALTFTVANPGVVFWQGTAGGGQVYTLTLTTNNPGGVNYRYQYQPNSGAASNKGAYSLTSTADSRAFNAINSTGGSKVGNNTCGGTVFHAN